MTDTELEGLTERIIGLGIEVHRSLGPGLLESVYRECMTIELREARLAVDSETRVPLRYKGRVVKTGFKLDLLVEGSVIVELKTTDGIHPIHLAQVITYLKLSGYPAGLLMNFNSTTLRAGLRRLYHPDKYPRTVSS